MNIEFSGRETLICAILVLFIGKFLTSRVAYLRDNNIPEPVTGGVLAAVFIALLYVAAGFDISFSLDNRDMLLVVFFTTIGLSSKFSAMLSGGKSLVLMLSLAVAYLVMQNLLGVSIMGLLGYPPVSGMLGGSISLSGGHGTAIAWAPIFKQDYGLKLAAEAAIASATFGLILGGLIGGPVARYLINRDSLTGLGDESITVGLRDEGNESVQVDHMLFTLLVIAVSMELGYQLHDVFSHLGFKMPQFVPCLLIAIVLTNTIPLLFKKLPWWPTGSKSLALVSDISLGLFLAMSLMSLKLWNLADVAGPVLFVIVAQLAMIITFCIFVVYRLMGQNYEAAVMSAGYAGFAMGATPTAIVNMTAVTKQFGAAPNAFIVIPLIGAFFIDISNTIVIQLMLNILG